MGIDLEALFGNAKDAVNAGMTDVLQQGGNAALGYLENQAIDMLSGDKATREKALQDQVAANLKKPSAPGSMGAYLSNVLSGPVIKQYGPYVLIGAAVIVVGTLYMRRS